MVTDSEPNGVTESDVTQGNVCRAVDHVIAGLGTLRGEQVVLAAAARALARNVDDEVGVLENVTRELRITIRELTAANAAATPARSARDAVARLQDEVALKRAQRGA